MLEPTSSVLVCGTPRCGSSFFCDLLTSTDVAGRPTEYFWCENVHQNREDWGVTSDREYLARTFEMGTTPNGVFGVKIMWNYFYGDFLLWLRGCLPELASLEDLTLIETVFPQPRFILITREDVVGQAVSWAKARQTGQWNASQPVIRDCRFDFEQIDHARREVLVDNERWAHWFAAHRIEPYHVTYEELIADGPMAVLRVLDWLGLAMDPGTRIAPLPQRTKLADSVNAAWVAQYRQAAALPVA